MRDAGDPFELSHIRYIRNREESMALNNEKEPAIIISASGMCEYGRIVHHLKNHCGDARNTILIVGFQAQHTLGRRIVERRKHIRIFGLERELNAKVVVMNEFSAHAGHSELIAFARPLAGQAEKILLVHGEEEALATLKADLQAEPGMPEVMIQEVAKPVEV